MFRSAIAAIAVAFAAAPATVFAAPSAPYTRPFVDSKGLAAAGYDVVSYFDGAPARGAATYFTDRNGARYLFVSARNKARFDAAPQKFEPQFSGYCVYGAAQGHKAPIEPQTGVVIGGKLYFNYNKAVAERFNKDRAGYIAKAEENWPRIRNDTPVQ